MENYLNRPSWFVNYQPSLKIRSFIPISCTTTATPSHSTPKHGGLLLST